MTIDFINLETIAQQALAGAAGLGYFDQFQNAQSIALTVTTVLGCAHYSFTVYFGTERGVCRRNIMHFDRFLAAGLLTILLCSMTVANPGNTGNVASDENTCRTFVQSFYKWYLTKQSVDSACKERPSAFSPQLLKLLNADSAAQQKSTDGIVGLDFDPILSTNSSPHAKYVVTKVTQKDSNYLVKVEGSGGITIGVAYITPEVSCTNGKCQFVNFHYGDFKPPDDNLVSILKFLSNERHQLGIK